MTRYAEPSFGKNLLMKLILAIMLIGTSLTACTNSSRTVSGHAGLALTDEEKHCLYAAALTAIDSPLESQPFKEVCQKIGIFDVHGNQNEHYMAFVQAHVEWAMKAESAPFRSEINSREKAREYLKKYFRKAQPGTD